MSEENKVCVTPEYLLTHGFFQYKSMEEGDVFDIPFMNEEDLHFREIEFHRQMFVLVFSGYNGDPKEGWHKSVYVQEDAGCGFVNIPFPWWDLPIEYFESVYYGIRGEKPKLQAPYMGEFEDISHEVILPKQLPPAI